MPFKSKAQARYMFSAAERGDIPKSVVKDFADKTKSIKRLPETVALDNIKKENKKESKK